MAELSHPGLTFLLHHPGNFLRPFCDLIIYYQSIAFCNIVPILVKDKRLDIVDFSFGDIEVKRNQQDEIVLFLGDLTISVDQFDQLHEQYHPFVLKQLLTQLIADLGNLKNVL